MHSGSSRNARGHTVGAGMGRIARLERLSGDRSAWASPAVAAILTALAYYLGGQAAFAVGTLTQQFAPFWPPNVVLLCAFLMTPPKAWPGIVAAVFPAHVL